MSDTREKVIKLQYPATVGDREYTELTLHPLKGKHVKRLVIKIDDDGSYEINVGNMIPVMASSAQVMPAVIEELDSADFMRVMQEVTDFLSFG